MGKVQLCFDVTMGIVSLILFIVTISLNISFGHVDWKFLPPTGVAGESGSFHGEFYSQKFVITRLGGDPVYTNNTLPGQKTFEYISDNICVEDVLLPYHLQSNSNCKNIQTGVQISIACIAISIIGSALAVA
jgi:hypothetical protein